MMVRQLAALPPKQALVLVLAEAVRRKQAAIAQGPLTAPKPNDVGSLILDTTTPYCDLMKPSRYKVLYGGRDSAKSWSVAEALIRRAATSRIRILCTREFQSSIKDSVHRLLVDTIYRLGLQGWFDITATSITSRLGSEFIFKGLHHNVHEIKSTEGIDICWVEEAHYTSHESWEILIPTIRKEGSEIWMTFNVTDEQAATYDRFVTHTPGDTIIHHVNYDRNPFLSATSKKEIEELKVRDYEAYLHVYEGHAKKISDNIIYGGRYEVKGFDSDALRIKAPRLHIGMDFGFALDPTAITNNFIIDNDLYTFEEAGGVGIEFEGKQIPSPIKPGEMMGELEQLVHGITESRKWPIKGDIARPETISFLRGRGFNITGAEKWKGSVEDGITHVKGFRKWYIHPRCKETIREARTYSYKRDQKTGEVLPVIVDKNNHYMDTVRYALDGYIQRRGGLALWAALGKQARQ